MADTIQVRLNGEMRRVPSGITIKDLLIEFELGPKRVAVAVNGAVTPRSEQGELCLHEGDVIELIQAVAGG